MWAHRNRAARGMNVLRRIRIHVMFAMMGGPPEHALLAGSFRQERQQELRHAGELVGAMAEVAMVAGSYREHAQEIKSPC